MSKLDKFKRKDKNNDNVFIKNSIYANTVNNINNVRSREYGKKGIRKFYR